jgi:hypothetical protein
MVAVQVGFGNALLHVGPVVRRRTVAVPLGRTYVLFCYVTPF